MTEEITPIGSIQVSPQAVATISYRAAMESYGVVGLTSKNLVHSVTNILTNDPTHGVEVHFDGEKIDIDLFIVIEYGTRIKSVANSVANTVRFHVEKALGMPVNEVNIHVQGLRISSLD